MLRFVALLVLFSSVCWFGPASVQAQDYGTSVGFAPPELEPRPKNGIAAIIVGAVLFGGALESFALIGLCGEDFMWASERSCRISNASIGAAGVAIAAPVLSLGIVRRKRYKAWREARSRNPHALESLHVTPLASGGGLWWSARF